jgi:hypothetical protein
VSSWRFQIGTNQTRETALTEDIGPTELIGVGCGGENSTMEKNVTKTEDTIASRTILRRDGKQRRLAEASGKNQGST